MLKTVLRMWIMDALKSSLTDDASSVADTLKSIAPKIKTSSKTLVSDSLENYTSSFKSSVGLYVGLSKYENMSTLLGQLMDSTV